jgi:hypothetical protein
LGEARLREVGFLSRVVGTFWLVNDIFVEIQHLRDDRRVCRGIARLGLAPSVGCPTQRPVRRALG